MGLISGYNATDNYKYNTNMANRANTHLSLNKNSNDMAKPFENGEFGKFGEYGENDEFDVERAPLIVVILTKMAHLAKILP